MIVQAGRRLFALHPLTAEAKRRMRRRRFIVAVLVVVLVGGAIGGSLELRSTSHFKATRPLSSAFGKADAAISGGRPSWGGGNGYDDLRFFPSAPFMLGTTVTNESSQPVTLTDIRVVLPRNSVIRQLGAAYEAGGFCFPGYCPPRGGGRDGTLSTRPLQVAPGKSALIQLNFRLLGCPQARHASLQNVNRIEATYRDAAGTIIHQRLGLGTTMRITTPQLTQVRQVRCRPPRPRDRHR